ncbi:hypothetical protein MtrunA17_Chr1g0148941 [Medicago truncatula]|nr:hypothetical protein MtrunA17_Chr1g0148941 [Medicago truncatula]
MQYKVDKDPLKHIIICQVVLGSVEKVELEFHQSCASRNEFDTGSDDPKWYVVWANDINNRILPVCVESEEGQL